MDLTNLGRRAAATGARLAAWAMRRLRERSTYAGLALLAGALGREALATQIGHVGDALMLLLGAGGVGLAAATTSPHPTAGEP